MAKVLLVEDDNNLRDIYQARLAAEGYEISTAQDGEEALVVAKQAMPDLVVSDVMMPKISGFEMLDILRNTPGLEHVKVIMLTALGQSEDRDRADSLGADKYLVKSQVTLEDIVKTAHELLGTSEPATPEADTVSSTTPPATAPASTTESPAATDTPPLDVPEPEPVVAPPAEPVTATPTAADDTADNTSSVVPSVTDNAVSSSPADQTTPAAVPPTTEPAEEAAASATPAPASESPANGGAAQEEALVQDQINNFVQSASDTPSASASSVSEEVATPTTEQAPMAAEPTSAPEAIPEPGDKEAQDTANDDKLMAEAVNELAGQVPSDEAAPPEVKATAPLTTSAPVVDEAPTMKEQPDNTNISLTGKKVIQPLDSKPKPDINELLAREEATNGTAASTASTVPPAPTGTPEVSSVAQGPSQSFMSQPPSEQAAPSAAADERPSGAPAPAPNEQKHDGGIDPNSIAL